MDEYFDPAPTASRIAQLSACLALVRPVGMTERETEDWLAVAAETLDDIPIDLLEDGAREARDTCTHHAQIVPTIRKTVKERLERRKERRGQPVAQVVRLAPREPLPEPAPTPLMTHEQLQTLSPALRDMGLRLGYLAQDDDGTLRWTTDAETAA